MTYATPPSVWTVVIIVSVLTISLAADLSQHPKDGNGLLQELWHTNSRLVPWWKRIFTGKYGGRTSSHSLPLNSGQDTTVENEFHKRSGPCPDVRSLSDGSVEVVSPGYREDENYPDNVVCTWTVSAPEGKRVQVHFVALSVEYEAACDYDSLKIYNGDTTTSPVMGTFCGDTLPGADLVTSGNKVIIVFTADGSENAEGFKITCSARDGATGSNGGSNTGAGDQCPSGSDVITTSNKNLHSPGYTVDDPYPNDAHCTWKIRVPSGKRVKIHFLSFTVEQGAGCSYDSLRIYDGHAALSSTTELANLCGSDVPQDIISPQNEITIVFDTDDTETAAGFSLTCEATHEQTVVPGAGDCPDGTDIITSPDTTIQSVGFLADLPYLNDQNCVWRIALDETLCVQLNAVEFNIENSVQCNFDSVTVFDGFGSTQLGKYCGSSVPQTIQASANEMTLVFKSDGSDSHAGFQFQIVAIPAEEESSSVDPCSDNRPLVLSTQSTAVTTPGYDQGPYPNDQNCAWKITAPENQVIKLKIVRFQLEYGSESCPYDHIQIFDGANAQSNQLARLCGTRIPQDITSTDNNLYIVFTSDSSDGGEGFKATYTFESVRPVANTACDASSRPQVLSGSSGEFTSPGYGPGSNYPDDKHCEWRISVPNGKKVKLHFNAFDLESDSSCGYDKVEVYEGSSTSGTLQGPFCGDSIPADILSSGNNLFVKFTSDVSETRPGFKITYSTENGGGGNGGGGNGGGGNGGGTNGGGNNNGNRNCGVQDPQFLPRSGNTRIVGGVEAKPHSWPWQISLGYGSSSHFCGGSIISPNWVITASHCVNEIGPGTTLYVRVGIHNLFGNTANSAQYLVDRIIMHPQYTTNPANNDIALLHLRDVIEYNEHVKPVCLPNARVPGNTRCLTTGWGNTQGTGNQRVLNQVYLPIVDQATCSQPDWYGSSITDVMVCAGYPEGRKDSCQGDSGGPLVCLQSGVYNLHGVTSWGEGCALAKRPGIYARMSEFVSWVQDQTGGAGQIP